MFSYTSPKTIHALGIQDSVALILEPTSVGLTSLTLQLHKSQNNTCIREPRFSSPHSRAYICRTHKFDTAVTQIPK